MEQTLSSACRIIDSAAEESTFDSLEAVLNFQESTVIIVLLGIPTVICSGTFVAQLYSVIRKDAINPFKGASNERPHEYSN